MEGRGRSYQTNEYATPVSSVTKRTSSHVSIRTDDGPYGLTATVWTNDLDHAQMISNRLDAGTGGHRALHDRE